MKPTLNTPIAGHVVVSFQTDLNIGDKVYFFDAVPFCDTPVLRAGILCSINIDMSYVEGENMLLCDACVRKASCTVTINGGDVVSVRLDKVFTNKESAFASIEVIE